MAQILSKRHIRDLLYALTAALCAAALLLFPSQSVDAAKDGLQLCFNVIIPSLFPFFVLSGFCVEVGLIRHIGRLLEPLMQPLFRVSGVCASAFVLGIIGGYPVGAKTAIALYEKKYISKDEAERLLAFCNNCGPAFVFGVVGAGIFASSAVGLLLYLSHILASVIIGFLFRFRAKKGTTASQFHPYFEAVSFSTAFTNAIRNGLQSVLSISAFVVFFTVIIRLLFLSGVLPAIASGISTLLLPLGYSEHMVQNLLIGFIEMSSGVSNLSAASFALSTRLSMAAFMLGWAGLCVHCQVLSFLGSSGLSVRTYLSGKILHGILSAVLTALFLRWFPIQLPVSSLYAAQIEQIVGLDFTHALTASTIISLIIWGIFSLIALWVLGKGSGNSTKNRV